MPLEVLLAAAFTFGCAAIHEWHEHAQLLTLVLLRTAGYLTLLTAMAVIALSKPLDITRGSTQPSSPVDQAASHQGKRSGPHQPARWTARWN